MTIATTPAQVIDNCRSDIWDAINVLKAAKDYGNADNLILEAARCGDMHEWLRLREEALMMSAE